MIFGAPGYNDLGGLLHPLDRLRNLTPFEQLVVRHGPRWWRMWAYDLLIRRIEANHPSSWWDKVG